VLQACEGPDELLVETASKTATSERQQARGSNSAKRIQANLDQDYQNLDSQRTVGPI